jgi:AcrR family transcriptional regulator
MQNDELKTSMKQTINNVAVDLFFRKGYFATSVSEIARGCGIQKASIYHHFSGKEELLFNIMNATMQELLSTLENGLARADGTEARMRAAVRGHVRFHLKRQKETFIASSELRGLSTERFDAIVARRDAYERLFQDLIRQGIDQGVFAAADVKVLSYAILTLCTAGASWFRPDGRMTADAIARLYENFVLNGLKANTQTLCRLPAMAS